MATGRYSKPVPQCRASFSHEELRAFARTTLAPHAGESIKGETLRRQLVAQLCRRIATHIGVARRTRTAPAWDDEPKSTIIKRSSGRLSFAPGENIIARHDVGHHRIEPAVSPRARQVLALLLAGDSEKQIARKLTLSPHTVHHHVKAIYRVHQVASRAELLARCLTTASPA